jgi:glutamine synthetase
MKPISLRFSDINGTLKEVLVSEEKFKNSKDVGIWFDGSSIQGLVRRYESDMRLKPDENSKFKLNGMDVHFCDVYQKDVPYDGDPRYILKRVVAEVEKLGYKPCAAGELEFYSIKDSQTLDKGSYLDVSPKDKAHQVKLKVVEKLSDANIQWDVGHHECGPGQNEIDIKYDDILKTADKILFSKNVIKLVAEEEGLTATFMPKPFTGLAGNGMHLHMSLWDISKRENLFYDANDKYNLSDVGKFFIGGIFEHAKAITAVTNPTVNSYKRLGEFEAPRYVYWGRKNRDALIRVPEVVSPSSTRIEYRSPDPSTNPYLAFAVLLKAGIDGVRRKVKPTEPIEDDIYENGRYKTLDSLPSTLEEALKALEKDKLVKETLKQAYKEFVSLKQAEWKEFVTRKVTDWEVERYFDV